MYSLFFCFGWYYEDGVKVEGDLYINPSYVVSVNEDVLGSRIRTILGETLYTELPVKMVARGLSDVSRRNKSLVMMS